MSDAFNVAEAQIVNSPSDIASWPVTAAITSLSFGTDGQTRVEFSKHHGEGRWPDVIPPGFEGPIQFTLWLFVQIGGKWVGSGFQEFWESRKGTGSVDDPDVPSVYNLHWYYAERWSPIYNHGPIKTGEEIGFMVSSGDARDSKGPYSVRERSNVVVVKATDNGTFVFDSSVDTPPATVPSAPPPIPAPGPDPVPPAPPVQGPKGDKGEKGDKGDKGDPGQAGAAGAYGALEARIKALEDRKYSIRVFGQTINVNVR